MREFLSIFSRSLALVSTKPFLQYRACGTPFFLHSATKFHSSFILKRPAEAAVTLRVIAITCVEEATWAQAQSFAPQTTPPPSAFSQLPLFLFPPR